MRSIHWSVLGFGAVMLASAPASATSSVEVSRLEFPVEIIPGEQDTVVGYLYEPRGHLSNPRSNRHRGTLQILLPGGTYNHSYWDAPAINGVDYSYARHMAEEGYSVLALDLPGTGESTDPPGDDLDIPQFAASVAQVSQSMRFADNPRQRSFDRIVLVGHSKGSHVAVYALGMYPNVADAFVCTGQSLAPHVVTIPPDLPPFDLSGPYITIPGPTRAGLFYHAPSADPDVIAYDNAHLADFDPRGLIAPFFVLLGYMANGDVAAIKAVTLVDRVDVPVYIQLGDHDPIAPAAVAPYEAALYESAPSVTIDTLPNMGHVLNLHVNHEVSWDGIEAWMDATLDD